MPDENRVFDVTKPRNVSPAATSRPVIVGHQPRVNDPMVKDESSPATKIMINSGGDQPPVPAEPAFNTSAPAIIHAPASSQPRPEPIPHYEGPAVMPFSEDRPMPGPDNSASAGFPANRPPEAHSHDDMQSPGQSHTGHIEGLHLNGSKPKKRRAPLYALAGLVIIVLIYLGLDAAGVNLPFHILKHQQPAPVSTTQPAPATQNKAPVTPALPSGFKEYKLAQTDITFAAPIAWGDPTSSVDPGYSKRGGSNQSDGTYAYLVNFATNKDIQIAVTSDKYLPPSRGAIYYDYLQWCTGTNDGKIYESVLHFTTVDKVDTPATITCDQGPVDGAVKLDSATIVQARATDSQNKVLGDIYTKNLNDPSLVVFRVKDAAMTSGDQIKKLLGTVDTGISG